MSGGEKETIHREIVWNVPVRVRAEVCMFWGRRHHRIRSLALRRHRHEAAPVDVTDYAFYYRESTPFANGLVEKKSWPLVRIM